jgi:hypothetical protein
MLASPCKNLGRPINVRNMGTFCDLLKDVGLSHQQGILVSVSRIGSEVRNRARELA